MGSKDRRRHPRKTVFYPAEAWTYYEDSWVQSEARIYNESTQGVRLRCREDLRGRSVLLRLSPDSDTVAVCEIVHTGQVARDCWEYGIKLIDGVDLEQAMAGPPVFVDTPKICTSNGDRHTPRHSLNATVRYESEGDEELVRLMNFSADGACFLTTEMPRTGASIILTIHDQSESFEFLGIIRWAEPTGEGHWRTGCQFDQTTLRFGVPAANKPDRVTCDVPILIHTEDKAASVAGNIVNHSKGGLGIQSEAKFVTGQRLLLEAEDCQFYVRIEWCSFREMTRVGCRFVSSSDREKFLTLITCDAPVPTVVQEPVETPRSTRHLWSACMFIYGWIGLYFGGVWPL